METLYQVLGLIGAGLIIFYLYQKIKNHPKMFSKANMNSSLATMGILGVGLIGFVAVLVLLTKYS